MSAVGDKNLLTKALSEKEVKLREQRDATNTPSHLFPPPRNKRFLPRKFEEKEFDSGDVVYHRTPFCFRTVSNRQGPSFAPPPGAGGDDFEMQTIS
jgi:hypothetical protein